MKELGTQEILVSWIKIGPMYNVYPIILFLEANV
jgi:hypothetical protein